MAKCQRTVPTSSIRPSHSWAVGRTFAWSRGSPLAPASVVGRRTRLRSCDGQARAARPGWKWQPSSAQTSPSASPVAPGQGCAAPAESSSLCRVEEVADLTYTLLVPPFGVATSAVYQAWDDLGGPFSDNFNDLEPAALRVEPRLASWRDQLADATGQRPVLAGSGSTWFVPGAHPGQSRVVVRVLRGTAEG